ncbi:MAG TPA: SDR family NAD(P)-dependent oxidoreductase, partial [Candidatus Atribacteria bacterium]|nr:SDR family NAD(P)-dependent oxidoreductase [Candidatus Atribacteria bacterium]
MGFSDKTVIITGAANGIGRGIALLYAEKGANVVVADIDAKAGTQTTALIKENGGEALFVHTDVRLESDIIRLMETAFQAYGRIDILINNAGIAIFKSPLDLTLTEWENVINTNLRSVFLGSREAAKYMKQNEDGGAIVNIASTRAIM